MRYVTALLTILTTAACASAQTVTLPADVQAPRRAPTTVCVTYEGDDVGWQLSGGTAQLVRLWDADAKKVNLQFFSDVPGTYYLSVAVAKDKKQALAVCRITVGGDPGPLPPVPPIPPGPDPKPPTPPPADELKVKLKAAWDGDKSLPFVKKAALISIMGGFDAFKERAGELETDAKGNPISGQFRLKTIGHMRDGLEAIGKNFHPVALRSIREIIATELRATGTDNNESTAIDPDRRARIIAIITTILHILELFLAV